MSTIVTVRIPKQLRKRLKSLGVNASDVIRTLLEEYIKEMELTHTIHQLKSLRKGTLELDPKVIVKVIREGRESR